MKITENDRLRLIGHKRCSKCGLVKPMGLFTLLKHGYYHARCKQCRAEDDRAASLRHRAQTNGTTEDEETKRVQDATQLRAMGKRRCKVCRVAKDFELFRGIPHRKAPGGKVWMNLSTTCLECEQADVERIQRGRQNRLLEERGERLCKECRKVKPLEGFYKATHGGYQTTCKDCWPPNSHPSPSSTPTP